MQEIQAQDQGRAGSKDSAGVIYFASQVVSLLAERNWRTFSELREPVVSGLITAALSGKKDAFADLLRELKKARVSAAALADLYIPEAARRMGDAWTDDQMSWLDVSIGVGRLQSLLREIGMAWVADQAGDTGAWHGVADCARPRTAHAGAHGGHGANAPLWGFGLLKNCPIAQRIAQSYGGAAVRWGADLNRDQRQIRIGVENRSIHQGGGWNADADCGGRGGDAKSGRSCCRDGGRSCLK